MAQPRVAEFRLWSTATVLPMQVVYVPGETSRLFGVDRLGRVRALDAATGEAILAGTQNGTVLDIQGRVFTQGDGGLLTAAFPADFATSRAFYVYYNRRGDFAGVLSRFHVNPGTLTADPAGEEVLMVTPRPNGHNGGWLGFSPVDGYLYLALGDGGTAQNPDPLNRSQTITGLEFAGKILRLDVSGRDDFPADPNRNYGIPPTNPFVGREGDDEIWSYGLRNPWRCTFDRATGDLWIGDVGQDLWEEVDFEPAGSAGGRNFGWRCMEGPSCTGLSGCVCGDGGLTGPLHVYGHDQGCSISAGVVYRGSAIPALAGAFLYTDWCSGRVWTLRQSGGQVTEERDWTDLFAPAGAERSPVEADPVAMRPREAGAGPTKDRAGAKVSVALERAIKELVPASPEVVFDVRVAPDAHGLAVPIAETPLLELLVILLRNAVEAMHGVGRCTVELPRRGERCHVEISDEGDGLPPDAESRLFTPGFTTKSGGSGFGLFLARRIVEDQGGRLSLASKPEKGAIAALDLPLVLAATIGKGEGADRA